jgi:MFS family permease
MSSEKFSGGQAPCVRLALLIAGWAITGACLFAVSTLLPAVVLAVIVVAAYVVVQLDRVSRKNKSLASLLCWITGVLTFASAVAMHFTGWHEDVLGRLIFVGLCLMAGLIVLDRRADDWQS